MLFNTIGFIFCAVLVVISGIRLSYHGNRIAEITGLGKAWVGLILMASITSLPELITGISSVVIIKAPNLAVGDIFGSCVFNLLILSILDFRIKKPITSLVKNSHVVAGFFSLILIAFAGLAILTSEFTPVFYWISLYTPGIIFIYIGAIWIIFRFDQSETQITQIETKPYHQADYQNLKKSFLIYGLNALIVIVSAIFLPFFGQKIALYYGLSNTFFGTLFLAASTSMPELVVSLATIRLKAFDMLVGNLFGSNIFNILILSIDDLFYVEGSIFKDISPAHSVSLLATIIMTAVAGLGVMVKPQQKLSYLGIDTSIILLIYILLMTFLFFYHQISI